VCCLLGFLVHSIYTDTYIGDVGSLQTNEWTMLYVDRVVKLDGVLPYELLTTGLFSEAAICSGRLRRRSYRVNARLSDEVLMAGK
jgi:hypothetical protein